MAIELVFFSSLAFIIFAYIGYPVLVFGLSRIFARPVRRAEITPRVSMIIAARNEEKGIAAKIENVFELDYPKDRLEVIVASDCSTDRTDEIVRTYADRGLILHRRPARLGKTVAQNYAIKESSGEILVFSDATTLYERDAIRQLVRSFADPTVGCVAGQLIYLDLTTAVGRGCKSYWSYEKAIKECESRIGSLIGVSGCIYAVRRSCHARLAHDMIDDFVIATEIHLQGLRTVYEADAIALEDTNNLSRDEFRMRVRVVQQTMNALQRYRSVLNLRRHGLFAWQLASHKILRYAVPFFLAVAFATNILLAGNGSYRLVLLAQTVCYLAALAGWAGDRLGFRLGPLALPYYFALANVASVVAFVKFLRGESRAIWEPARVGLAGPEHA